MNQSDNRRKDFPRNNGQQNLSIKFSQSVGTLQKHGKIKQLNHGITLPQMNVVNENIEEEIEQEKKEELEM